MENSLLEKIESSLSKSSKSSSVNIVNDKLTLSVFDLLKKSLSRVAEINLVLRDKNVDLPADSLVREFELNPSEALFNAYDITQKNKLQHFEQAKQMASFIEAHVSVKKTTPKCQIKGNVLLVDDDFMIQGSSSLELAPKSSRSRVSNINFDSIISDTMDKGQIVAARETFNRIWNNDDLTDDYKQEILNRLEALYKEHSPEFLYYFTLHSLFGHQLDSGIDRFEEDNMRFKETKIWNMLYDFQKDCVLSAIQKINKYNGCIIADSVGLGKTFEALAVIKYYELRQDNVLVLTPAKLYDNWNSFKGAYKDSVLDETFYYKIMFHTDLSRYKGDSKSGWDLARFDWSKFDLVVIDESHNFRNRVERDEEEGFTRYQRLLYDVIKSNQKTKVLLLSATPVNNSLKDLRNQISIITADNDSAFEQDGIPSVSSTLNETTRAIGQWNADEEADKSQLLDSLPSSFYTILEKMTIARSRKHITEFYKNSDVGTFPEKLKPDTYTPHIDTEKTLLDFHETNLKLEELLLAVYIPMNYIKPEHRAYYREKYQTTRDGKVIFSHEDREFLTAKMHRFNLFKRLDSSIAAFHQTLTRLLAKIDSFITVLKSETADLSYEEEDDSEDQGAALDYKYDLKVAHLKREEYLTDLEADKFLISAILKESQQILDEKRDNKLLTLTELIQAKVRDTPYNPGNKKILIFSAFADTTRYLYSELEPLCNDAGLTLATISGTGPPKVNDKRVDASFHGVLSAFSPKSKLRNELAPEDQVDILIGTDCLSEGQNLQDCDCVVNYDVQWNPVTLIQRFGRIDRIGSVNTHIKMISFFPDVDLNEYLDLENRVKTKMVTANLSSTGGDDILTPEMNDISFRSRQLKRLKDEVIELEDTNENLSLTDLNMNEYLYELAEYLKQTPDLTTTPTGIYSIVSAGRASSTILPEDAHGVLFCFKHRNIFDKPKSDSSLYPYYLVYVAQDGTIRLSNNQARESLKFLRKACINQSNPIPELVEAMLAETDECRNMSTYSSLLNQAIQSIQKKEAESSEETVFDFGGFNNPFAEEDADDFELISFLIVRP
ncbi:MAG: DEAD/DEAH box helicase [Verrucomicrobiales bacterium]|nr:DEAD/DEAH box helicase [Verrucomicrobiales bacterium]